MKFLRTVSTQRLLAIIVGLIVAIGGGAAIAVAAAGNGPVPKREPLAEAIHQALSAPMVTGISARITFTNNLIDAGDFQGQTDPILQGAIGRLWMSDTPGDHRLRIELQSDNGDAQIVFNNGSFSVYDPSSNTAYEGTLPSYSAKAATAKGHTADAVPTVAKIQNALGRVSKRVDISGAIPSDVAGQPTYTVRVSPQHAAGLFGDVQMAWDALRGVPLRIAVYARGDATPVLQLAATDVSFGAVPAGDFQISPPPDAKVVKISTQKLSASVDRSARRVRRDARHAAVSGAAAVASRLPFKLDAPGTLAGLPRRSVSLLDWAGHPAALVAYGKNLGGIAVIEQLQTTGASNANTGGGQRGGLSLPTVSINRTTGTELDTALGTLVRFTRGQVAYTVIGSVPPAAADAAARGL
jgi:outer membrane lipoprotein-sorting protein